MKNFKNNLKYLSFFYIVGLLNFVAVESFYNRPYEKQASDQSKELILKLEKIFTDKRFEIGKMAEDKTCKGINIIKLHKDFNLKDYEDKNVTVLKDCKLRDFLFSIDENGCVNLGYKESYSHFVGDTFVGKRYRWQIPTEYFDFSVKNNLYSNVLGQILIYDTQNKLSTITGKLPVEIHGVPAYIFHTGNGNVLMNFVRENTITALIASTEKTDPIGREKPDKKWTVLKRRD